MPPPAPIHPATRIGHVHLKVADLERTLGFYGDVLGPSLATACDRYSVASTRIAWPRPNGDR